jgi:hypothetical protein
LRLYGGGSLLAGGVEFGTAFAEAAIVGAVAMKVFSNEFALFAGGVVVVDGDGTVGIQSFS